MIYDDFKIRNKESRRTFANVQKQMSEQQERKTEQNISSRCAAVLIFLATISVERTEWNNKTNKRDMFSNACK